ncbi:MAG: gliding motility-associated C-terminal domain-containing protein [Bacteroidetes bacterium]|nr:gliding motility-associated C-terminal domain-containing protein [Bacteroidota bacterium]
MNRVIIFFLFVLVIASCKKEKQKPDYDSLITYETVAKTYNVNCSCTVPPITFAFYVPTGFTPNGDGSNDYWEPKSCGLDSSDYHLSIFDRTGKIIVKYNTPAKFDGRGTDGNSMAMQTLGYYIEAKDKNGEYYKFQGKFTLFL